MSAPPVIACRRPGCGWVGPPPNSRHPQCPRCHSFFDVPANAGRLRYFNDTKLRKGKKK